MQKMDSNLSQISDYSQSTCQKESNDVDSILRKFVPNLDIIQNVAKKGPKIISKKIKPAKAPMKVRARKSAEIKNPKKVQPAQVD